MIRGIAVVAVSAMALGGCASSTDRQMQYDSYTAALIKLAELQANAKPVVDTKFTDSGGKEVHLVVNLPVQMQQVQQIKNDEELAFWGQVINGSLGVVGNVGTAFMNGYFSYKNNEAMWGAIGGGLGGSTVNTSGGDFTATNSLNGLEMNASGGSSIVSEAFTEKNPIVSGEGTSATVGGITATPSNSDDDTTTTTTTTTNTATDSPTTNTEEGLF